MTQQTFPEPQGQPQQAPQPEQPYPAPQVGQPYPMAQPGQPYPAPQAGQPYPMPGQPHAAPHYGQPYPMPQPGQPYLAPQAGQPFYGAPVPPAPPKKPFFTKTWFIVLAGLLLFGIIASAVSGGGKDASSTSASSGAIAPTARPTASAPATPRAKKVVPAPAPVKIGIGQPARDGKFEFVVNRVDCGTKQIGGQYFNTKAQGQFCIVDLTIKNIGNEPQSFFGANATLINAQGQQFSASSEAAIYLPNSSSLYEEINPGNTLNSKVVFDVPVGTALGQLELHDSAYSGGVKVSLQ